jgi:hypothetical protein
VEKPKSLFQDATLNKLFLFSVLTLLFVSCNSLAGDISTSTPKLTETPIPLPSFTPSPIPAITSTYTPTLPLNLPTIPNGFTWKIVEETQIGFPIPDGWFYKEEKQGNTYAYFATKENIDGGKIFSTGLTINIVKDENINAAEEAERYINGIANSPTTKKIIGNWHYSQADIVSFQIEVEAEFPQAPNNDPNRNKTIHYTTAAKTDTNTLYLIIFESPTSIWNEEKEKGKYMIQLVFLGQ